MTLIEAIQAESGSYAEVLAAVQARTVTVTGRIPGAELGAVLLSLGIGLVGFITDKAAATGTSSIIRDICIGLADRFKPDGEVDFSNAENVALIDAFLVDAEVQALLASPTLLDPPQPAIPAEYVKGAILTKASTTQPEFPSVTLRDVIAVKTPELAMQQESLPVTIKGISQVLKLTTAAAMPETTRLSAQISHDGIVWQPVSTSGLEQVSGAGLYVFRVLPGPVFITESQIRVVSDYSVGLSLV